MASNTNDYSIRPLGLLIYRRRNKGKVEVLIQSKDGKYCMPHILLNEREKCCEGAERIATEELGIDLWDLRMNKKAKYSDHYPDFRFRLMTAVPCAELPFFIGETLGGRRNGEEWRWEVLSDLDRVYMYPGKPGLHCPGATLCVAIHRIQKAEEGGVDRDRLWTNIASEIERSMN